MKTALSALTSGLAALLLSSCASTFIVRSEPSGASVSIREMGSTEEKTIGQTPLSLTSKELSLVSTSGPFYVSVRHPEFGEKSAYITRLDGQDIELFLKLDSNLKSSGLQPAEVNSLVDSLFQAQSLANQKNTTASLNLLNKLAEKYPKVGAIYELRGSVNILMNDIQSALRDYNVAVQLNPASLEATRIQKELQTLATRKPSSVSGGGR